MLRLYILRHAKSSWANPGVTDFERELNARGNSDLVKIARAVGQRKYQPAQILCSPAVRTTQTLEGIRHGFDAEPEITYSQKLYSSGLSDYLEMLQELQSPSPVMIIGHNPMCGNLAATLSGSGTPQALESLALKFPTGAMAIIDFKLNSWSKIKKDSGYLRDCMLPRTLTAS